VDVHNRLIRILMKESLGGEGIFYSMISLDT